MQRRAEQQPTDTLVAAARTPPLAQHPVPQRSGRGLTKQKEREQMAPTRHTRHAVPSWRAIPPHQNKARATHPKSHSLTRPRTMSIFSSLTSQWTISSECTCWSAEHMSSV